MLVSVMYSSGGVTFHLFPHGFKGDKIEIYLFFNHLNILLKVAQFKGKIVCSKNTPKVKNLAIHCTHHAHTTYTHDVHNAPAHSTHNTPTPTYVYNTRAHNAHTPVTHDHAHTARMHNARAQYVYMYVHTPTHYTYAHYARNPDVLPAI